MKTKKVLSRIMSLCLSFMLAFAFVGCDDANTENSGTAPDVDNPVLDNNVAIWSADISDKILQDKKYNYSAHGKSYDITMVKGETEGGQLIITPEKAVKNYSLTLNDLKDAKGNVLSKDCFKVYNQKYMDVTATSDGSSPTASAGVGVYPDALLPMDKAVEYHENKIDAGKNQGITIECKVADEQKAGNYTGEFNILIDGVHHAIKANVHIIDYLLTDNVSAKSCFMMNRGYMEKGGDSTLSMYEKYYDFMLDHRVSAFNIPCMPEEIESYVQAVAKYTVDPRCASIAIPQFTQYNGSVGDMDIDMDKTKRYLDALADYSVKNNINLFEKAYFHYGTVIDEPDQNNLEGRAIRVSKNVNKLKNDLVKRIEEGKFGDSASEELIGKMVASVKAMPHPVTTKYTDKLYDNGNGVLNYCPQFDKLDREKLKELGNEYWWYGCIGPQNPYPSYHIDDKLVTSRILSWMQKDYGVSGNLYWETCFWFDYDNATGRRTPLNDLYSYPMRFPGCNGDGFLLYPGQPYGIDGPVSSVRLSAIRDGLEEYEILSDLERCYKNAGLDYNDIMQQLYKEMYSDVRVNCESNVYMRNRKILYQLAELMQKYDTYIAETENGGSERAFTIKSTADVILVNGKKLEKNGTEDKYNLYNVLCEGEKAFGYMNVEVTKGEESSLLTYYLGGAIKELINVVSGGESKFTVANGSVKYLENADKPEISGSVFEFTMSKNNMAVLYENENLNMLGLNTESIMFNMFNCGTSDIKVTVTVKGTKKDIYERLGTFELHPGINHTEISGMTAFNWESMGDITAMKFTFEGNENAVIIMSTTYMKEA